MKYESHPDLATFVLNGLEPEEAAEVRRHLARCPECRKELRELERVSSALEAAPPLEDPPDYLKDEVLSRVRAGESSSGNSRFFEASKMPRFVLPGAAAACVVAMLALGVFFGLREGPPSATIQLVPTPREAGELEGYWGVAEVYPQPSGNLRVELNLNNFGEPERDSFYEAWFVSGERRISAGSFTSVGEGRTDVWLTAPPEAGDYPTLLITEERADDSSATSERAALEGEVP